MFMHPNQPSRGGVLGCIPLDVAVFAAFALTRTHAVLRVQCTVLTPSCRRKHNAGFWRRAEDVAEAPVGGELIDAGQVRINDEKGRGAVVRGVGVGACARRSVSGQGR